MSFEIEWQLGTESGRITVNAEDEEQALAKARKRVRSESTLVMAAERYRVVRSWAIGS